LIKRFTATAAGAALAALCIAPAFAQPMSSPAPMATPAMGGSMGGSMSKGSMSGAMTGPDHGMPEGTAGGDGVSYKGAPDLQGAISLVVAGGAPGHFSIVKALTALAGAKTANAEVAKLTKQYGAKNVASFVAVQNFAVNDAVAVATKAGVKFPSPAVHGTALAVRVVKLGLVDGTYYEGVQLDHLVTNAIHETVMGHIDGKFGVAADANYHRIANQAHYDLAQALGAKTVKLAAFH
jgi:hypothetical protein